MKFYLFSFILESAVERSEAEVVLGCENYVQVDAFIVTVVDFTMLYVVAPVAIIVSRFIVGNRPFARWRHFTTERKNERILVLYSNLEIPARFK